MSNGKTALVLGSGGFIGNHLVSRLKSEGYWVRGVDLKKPEYNISEADHFVVRDLRDSREVDELIGYAGSSRNPHQIFARQFDQPFDEIYQLAADMGGIGYIATGENDANIMHNSAQINLNVLNSVRKYNEQHGVNKTKIFYSSSACVYPQGMQTTTVATKLNEMDAYPADPDSEYGWEKLFSERLYQAYNENYKIPVRIARFHNIYGPFGTYKGGKEKAPAALCRKVYEGKDSIEIWGNGAQTRSFLYIDDCIDAVRLLMNSHHTMPMNIGSEESISISDLARMIMLIAGKNLTMKFIPGPVGVNGRNSDNALIETCLEWKPKVSLQDGMTKLYTWIRDYENTQTWIR